MSNFTKIRLVGIELFYADGQTDMTKLIVAFRIFCRSCILIKITIYTKKLESTREATQLCNLCLHICVTHSMESVYLLYTKKCCTSAFTFLRLADLPKNPLRYISVKNPRQ
jgi:hypothetical protein